LEPRDGRFELAAVTDMIGRTGAYALLAISLLIFGAMSASAQSRSFYNERGSFAGQSFTRGNSTSFSDGQGRFSGSAIRHGNSTSFYDGRGRFTGSVVNNGLGRQHRTEAATLRRSPR
jgi:hypothetical protein